VRLRVEDRPLDEKESALSQTKKYREFTAQ
jgi:hypothetical protein